MTTAILLSEGDLRALIREELFAALAAERGPTGFLKVPEAAAFLAMSEDALRALVKRSAVPFHKRGGRLFFDCAELTAWVKSGEA